MFSLIFIKDLNGLQQSFLPKLKKLNLADNENLFIDNFKVFETTPLLEYLSLNGANGVTFLSDINLEKLRTLLMSQCQVAKISNFHLPHLEILDLAMNNLTNVDPTPLRKLSSLQIINLSGNHFHCDCNLHPMVQWIQEVYYKIEVVDADTYMCETPDAMYTEFISDIWDYMNCTEEVTVHAGASYNLAAGLAIGIVLTILVLALGAFYYHSRVSSNSDSSNPINDCIPCKKSKSLNRSGTNEMEQQELMTVQSGDVIL